MIGFGTAAVFAQARETVGRAVSVSGSQVAVGLPFDSRAGDDRVTVGKFLGVQCGPSVTVGIITRIAEKPNADLRDRGYGAVAELDLVGEIRDAGTAGAHFQCGVVDYPAIGNAAILLSECEIQLLYDTPEVESIAVGDLHHDAGGLACIRVDETISRHFAILGTTGVGKSSAVAVLLQEVLAARPNLRIFLIDPHNEYARCFGRHAQVMTPRNLRLPFWLFNFEEIADVFFGGRPGHEDEVQALAEAIPRAKAMYLQYRGPAGEHTIARRREPAASGYSADTPVPYRLDDLVGMIDEQMGKLENRATRMVFHKLKTRIQTVRHDPRYAFMFENANLGGDTMADVLSDLFRLPPNGVPMTIMQLAGFPTEVIDSVVSVLGRMAFDFGLWSDGIAPLLFVCEEAHRYAPADRKIGFGPTRRALSRIAKEGRKYGVFLGLVTQRPAEIDPTIISQCNTLFVMRMANERDQALIRSAVSDAAANLLNFVPSLGTREALAFGTGVSVPTRFRFKELPAHLRPHSEAGGATSVRGVVDRALIESAIERWRSATMSQKSADDALAGDMDFPADPTTQPHAAPIASFDPDRFSVLRKDAHFGSAAPPHGRQPLLRR